MSLTELESTVASIGAWAKTAKPAIAVHGGIIELGATFPEVTVVGFSPDDVALFLALATELPSCLVVIDAPVLTEEDLRLAEALAEGASSASDDGFPTALIEEARGHLGEIHRVTATAFAPGLGRALRFRAETDWGAPLFGLMDLIDPGDDVE